MKQIKDFQYHANAANAFAGKDYIQVAKRRLNIPSKPSGKVFERIPAGPVKLFDNLYYVGYEGTGAFVLTTSDGIIVIDSINNDYDAEHMIIGGMKEMGLDPAQIKYVLITHGHGDHYGGARYLQEHFGAHVLMSEIDWEYMVTAPPNGANGPEFPEPIKDMVVVDKQKFTLGDTTITVVLTPGHTPGCVSLLIPIKDNGEPHIAALWGGTGFPKELEMKWEYLKALEYFSKYTKAAHVDVKLCSHPYNENSLEYMKALCKRKPGEPNPFVIGHENYLRYENVLIECIKAHIAFQLQEK